ncbi:MAG: copper chaperone PCu(A)C [Comamonadaceae bacterium]|nr:copper chaperone PCu(A)C [Pseudomonadota bacterium]MDE2413606.1 copper chaperone PCu(A)C [Comamonadaceae bacterium]
MPAKRLTTRLALAAALLLSGLAHAQVNVQDAWVRATVPQQKATGAFMRLTAAQDMRLVGASSPAAGVTEVHEMKLVDNVMKMRAVPLLELPAGQAVELKPGGYHIMLLDLKQPVAQGATVPLTLVFEGKDGQRQSQELQVPARALGAAAAPAAGHGKHGGH